MTSLMAVFETLCRCGHLTSDHVTIGEWTPGQLPEFGETPCARCNEFKDRFGGSTMVKAPPWPPCPGFSEWPISEMPKPGTMQAFWLGCRCPLDENIERNARHAQPVYADDCPLHEWICRQGATCEHEWPDKPGETYTLDHRGQHYSCEHCTIPRIECDGCGKIWFDWRVKPETSGWKREAAITAANTTIVWRCGTCSSVTN